MNRSLCLQGDLARLDELDAKYQQQLQWLRSLSQMDLGIEEQVCHAFGWLAIIFS